MNRDIPDAPARYRRFVKHLMVIGLFALGFSHQSLYAYECTYDEVTVDPTDSYLTCVTTCPTQLHWVPPNNMLSCNFLHQQNWCRRYCADAEADVCEGNPIKLSSGAKLQFETDYQGTGEYPLTLKRYYSTGWTTPEGNWGEGWLGTDSARIVSVTNDSEGDTYTAVRPNGSYLKFTWVGGGITEPIKSDTKATLTLYNYQNGLIWVLRLPDGSHEIYDFDQQAFIADRRYTSRLLWTKWRGGLQHVYAYNTADQLETITHTNGQQLQFSYNADGRIDQVTAPGGKLFNYDYDAAGNLVSVAYPGAASNDIDDTATKTYLYEDSRHPHHLTGILDESGQRYANYAYDDEGRTILSEHGDGGERIEVLEYGNSVRTRNALGKEAVYHFGTSGSGASAVRQLLTVDGVASASCAASNSSYSYDENGFKDLIKDENDFYTDLDYDSAGQLVRKTEALVMVGNNLEPLPETRVTEFDWMPAPALNLPSERREPGKTTNYSYQNERLIRRTETDTSQNSEPYSTTGNSRTWAYNYTFHDVNERQVETITIDGPLPGVGDTSVYTFDALGNLTSFTNPLSHVVQHGEHTEEGRPGQVIDANGLITELEYNALGLLTATHVLAQQGTATTRFAYHSNRLISRVTLPDDSFLSFEYNAAQHLTAISNSQGERIEYTPNLLDGKWSEQIVQASDGTITQTKRRVFDELGRVIHLLGADTQQTDYSYDPAGNRISQVEQGETDQIETQLNHDGLKRLTTLTDPLQHLVQFAYDAQGNVGSVTDQRANTTSYVYDGFNNLIQQTSPDSGTTVYNYDEAGNRIRQVDARGVEVIYDYDLLNRIIGISYPADPEHNAIFTYDEGSNALGRLTTIEDPSGVTRLSYDERGNLVTHSHTADGEVLTLEYQYDLANNLIQETYPSGRVVTYSRDAQGRIAAISTRADDNAPDQTVVTGVHYQPYGPLAGLSYGNGLDFTIAYDLDGRITGMETRSGLLLPSGLSYDYNRVNEITRIFDEVTQEGQLFDYDLLHRLTQADGHYGTEGYDYDPVHNRTLLQQDSATTTYGYAADSNRLIDINGGNIGVDEVGNRISQGYKTLSYDSNNRLSEVKTSGAPLGRYQYDALGQRREKILGTGSQTRYVYDRFGRLVTEIRDGELTEYLYLETQPVAVTKGGFIGSTGDRDNDGIPDAEDNCSAHENPGQVDSDGDGYGNRCDPDLNNDGVVDHDDLMLYLPTRNTSLVGRQPVGRQYNPMMDFNSDQAINGLDFWILKTWYFSSEGAGPGAMNQPDAPQLSYIHFEHRGAPIGVSNESGDMVWQADYRPFGEVEELTDVDGDGEAFALNLRYPGQYHDRESGYYYNYFRDYDPVTGRYLQSDSIGLAGGINTYGYVQGNPVNRIDPQGNIFFIPLLGWSAGAILGDLAVIGGISYWWMNSDGPASVAQTINNMHNESADGDDADCPESDAPVDDAEPGRKTKGKTTQWEKDGGFDQANDDFDGLNPDGVRTINTKYGPGRTGTLPDGRSVVVRPGSSDGRPTLEVRKPNGRGHEVRYN